MRVKGLIIFPDFTILQMAKKQKPQVTPTARAPKAEKPKNNTSSFWDNLPSRNKHLIAAVFLLLVGVFFFSDIVFGGKSLMGHDSVQSAGMAKTIVEDGKAQGEQALWATNMFGGMPAYQISYPIAVWGIDSLLLKLSALFGLPIIPFLIMAFGAYFLGYYLAKNHLAALLAAVATSLTTYMPIILMAGHNSKFVALAYVPWVLLAFVHCLRNPSVLNGLFFALALAVELRANHVQITYYLAFFLFFWWIAELVANFKSGETKKAAWGTGFLAIGALLAVLMVAQPYFPVNQYKAQSIRGMAEGGAAGSMDWEYATNWSQGLGELSTLLIAHAYGGGSKLAYWGGKTLGTSGPYYMGGIIILLAVFGLVASKNRAKWGVFAGTVFTMILSLGRNAEAIYRPFYEGFPLFDSFRAPEMWLSIATFGWILLAILGWKAAFKPEKENDQKWFVVGGGMVAFVLILMLFKSNFYSFEQPGEVQKIAQLMAQQAAQSGQQVTPEQATPQAQSYIEEQKVERQNLFQTDAIRTFIFVLLAFVLIYLARKKIVAPYIAQIALVLLVVIDLWGVGKRYFPTEELSDAQNQQEVLEGQKTAADDFIIQKTQEAGGRGAFRTLPLVYDAFQDARTPYFYESVGGYHPAKLRLYQDFISKVLTTPEGGINPNGLDLANTRFVLSQDSIPGFKVAFTDPQGIYVLERENYLARAFFVNEVKHEPNPEKTWKTLSNYQKFDVRKTALVSQKPTFKITADSTNKTTVKRTQYNGFGSTWEVSTQQPAFLVLSEVYYPQGWTATLNDKPVEIYQTNYWMRGVAIPKGKYTLKMTYKDETHDNSVLISMLASLLVYGGIFGLGILAFRQRIKD